MDRHSLTMQDLALRYPNIRFRGLDEPHPLHAHPVLRAAVAAAGAFYNNYPDLALYAQSVRRASVLKAAESTIMDDAFRPIPDKKKRQRPPSPFPNRPHRPSKIRIVEDQGFTHAAPSVVVVAPPSKRAVTRRLRRSRRSIYKRRRTASRSFGRRRRTHRSRRTRSRRSNPDRIRSFK